MARKRGWRCQKEAKVLFVAVVICESLMALYYLDTKAKETSLGKAVSEQRSVLAAPLPKLAAPSRQMQYIDVAWQSQSSSRSGCVKVDLSNGSHIIPLDEASCNGKACPQCFLISNVTSGAKLSLTGCSSMLVGKVRMGSGILANALQRLEIVNSGLNPVMISDNRTDVLCGAKASVTAFCGSQDKHTLHFGQGVLRAQNPFWQRVNQRFPWEAHNGFGFVVLPNGALLVLGGARACAPNSNLVCTKDVSSWRSSDGGFTWQKLANASFPHREYPHTTVTANGSVLLCCGFQRFDGDQAELKDLWSSDNSGDSWTRLVSHLPIGTCPLFNLLVLSSGTIFVGYKDHVLKSEDGGYTWSGFIGPAPSCAWTHLHQLPDESLLLLYNSFPFPEDGIIMQSFDEGETWTVTSSEGWPLTERLYGVQALLNDGRILHYGGYNPDQGDNPTNEVWIGSDGGKKWTQGPQGPAPFAYPQAGQMAVHPDGSVFLLVPGGFEEPYYPELFRLPSFWK